MKRASIVLCLGLLLVITSLSIAGMNQDKTEMLNLDQAVTALNNGLELTDTQIDLLTRTGYIGIHSDELDRTVGPDDYGYMLYDSEEENGPEFNWIDISETGTEVAGMGDDGTQGPFDIPFPFPFYGDEKTQIWFGYNGSVGFNNGIGTLGHNIIPAPGAPDDVIQFWQRDMHCGYGFTTVFYQEMEVNGMNAFVVEYNHISQYGAAHVIENTVSCEIIMFANGNIIVQYDYVGETISLNTMSVGIENADGTDGLQYCYNNADEAPTAGTAILYTLGEENASVDGIVYDACTEMGIEGAEVSYGGYTAITDADGYYIIEAMYPRPYMVEVLAEGYVSLQDDVVIEEGENSFDWGLYPYPEIAFDPEQFLFEVDFNGQDSDILTISNASACAADLIFDIGITYFDQEGLALQAVRNQVRENLNNLRATPGTTIYTGPPSTDVGAFPTTPTGVRLSELDEPYYLLIQNNGAWGGEENQELMTQLEIPFDIIGEQQMGEWELDEYTVLVFTSCQSQQFYNTFEANHDRFEEWVRAGGWIDFHGCIQGATIWSFWDGMTMVYGTAPQNMVVEPDHPIVEGVNEVINGTSASHNYITDLSEDALVIMENNNGQPTVAEVGYGRGNVIVNTQTWEFYFARNPAPDNCGSVMMNAFGYTMLNAEGAGSWLTVEPDRGAIEADHSADLDVIVNAEEAELTEGIYEAQIEIESNAVTGETEFVFVTLIVGHPGIVEGTVTDSETGDPLEGAIVTAWLDGEVHVEVPTNVVGHYSMSLGEGPWDLSANIDDYYQSDIEVVNVVEGQTVVQDFELDHEIPPFITVDPDNFVFEADWGLVDSDVFTIGNTGGLPLHWSAAITYVEPDEMARFERNRRLREEAKNNPEALLARRQANIPQFVGNEPGVTSYDPSFQDLIIENDAPRFELDEGPFLLMGNTDFTNSLARALDELDVEYTFIRSDNYATAGLEDYGTLICGHDGGNPTVQDAQAAIDFVDNGGTLMYFGGTPNMANTFNAEGFIGVLDQGWRQSPPPHFNVDDPGHPLAANLPEEYTFTNQSASYNYIRYNVDNAEVAASNGEGTPILFSMDYGSGLFLTFANSPHSGYWMNPADFEVLRTIMDNMLNYASGWLTVDPLEGIVDIQATQDVDIFVDAVPDSLFAGTYEAFITISAEHPDTDPVDVWVTYTVIGGPPHHQFINLRHHYFNMISFLLDPVRFGNDAAEVFGDLLGLDIVYQANGDVYIPGVINDIGAVDPTQGYRVFLTEPEQILHVQGDMLDPMTEYFAPEGVWSWIGYPLEYPTPVDVALAEIVDELIIVIDDNGGLWIPGLINTMGDMYPGKGYMVLVDEDVTFTYNVPVMLTGSTSEVWDIPEMENPVQSTGLPYPVFVTLSEDIKALEPASIEVYDGKLLVGNALVLEDQEFTPVVTWQGVADYGLRGFTAGNPISVVLKSADGSVLPVEFNGENALFGEGAYASVNASSTALPVEFSVSNGYPNPFNPSVTVPFALPSSGEVQFTVFNILGQQIFHSNRTFEAGTHRFVFDAAGNGQELVSGVYFLQVNYEGQLSTQKLMLLK